MRVAAAMVAAAALASCSLRDAAFGRTCDVDDDCRAEARDGDLVCLPVGAERRCVNPPFVESTAEGETCADAIALTLDLPFEGTTADAFNDLEAICAGRDSADRAYRIDLDETTNLRVVLEPTGFDGALFASVDDGCLTQVAGSCKDDEHTAGGTETLLLPGVGPGRIYIVVDGADTLLGTTSGPFRLTVSKDGGCAPGFNAVDGRCIGVLKEVEQIVDRTNAAATLLDDGRVLITGGRTGPTARTTATAEIFDPLDDTFSLTGQMAVDRARHCSERMQDGRVLVAGGVRGDDGDYAPTASVEVYDPVTDEFSPAPDLPRARDLFTCTELGRGRGLVVVGGRDGTTTLGDAWLLDRGLTAWTPGESLGLREPRFGHLAFLVDDANSLFVVGGRTGTEARALDSLEGVLIAGVGGAGSEPLNAPRAAACGVALDDRHFMVFGGYEGSFDTEIVGHASVEIYDNNDDDWKAIFNEMNEPRLFATANLVRGLGVVIAGGSQDLPTASVDLYVEDDEAFVALPPLHHARLAHAGVTLNDGRVLIVGGDGGDDVTTVPLSAAELIGVAP